MVRAFMELTVCGERGINEANTQSEKNNNNAIRRKNGVLGEGIMESFFRGGS